MGTLLASVMLANAALFFFGALQHAGIALGPFREPRIVPAAIVEILCGFALIWGGLAVLSDRARAALTALIANIVAACGVALGMAALAAGAGPRTGSNDLYHRIMLVLIGAAVAILLVRSRRPVERRG
jgi:hypothetical protein